MPPKQADMAMRGYPCRATVMSEKKSEQEIKKGFNPRIRACTVSFAMWNTCVTSDAVAPGQECEAQHGITEAENHAQHVQDTDHLGGCCTDQHSAHYEAQHCKHLQQAHKQDSTFQHCWDNRWSHDSKFSIQTVVSISKAMQQTSTDPFEIQVYSYRVIFWGTVIGGGAEDDSRQEESQEEDEQPEGNLALDHIISI